MPAAAEIAAARVLTAWDALSRLRPNFLMMNRAAFRVEPRIVYLDGMKLASLSEVRTIPAAQVREIRMLGPSTRRFATEWDMPAG